MGLILRDTTPTAPMNYVPMQMGEEKSDDFTATKGSLELVDVTENSVTVIPPPSPIKDDRFGVVDSRAKSSTNNITVDFAGAEQLIHGYSDTFLINQNSAFVLFRYTDNEIGWIVEK